MVVFHKTGFLLWYWYFTGGRVSGGWFFRNKNLILLINSLSFICINIINRYSNFYVIYLQKYSMYSCPKSRVRTRIDWQIINSTLSRLETRTSVVGIRNLRARHGLHHGSVRPVHRLRGRRRVLPIQKDFQGADCANVRPRWLHRGNGNDHGCAQAPVVSPASGKSIFFHALAMVSSFSALIVRKCDHKYSC